MKSQSRMKRASGGSTETGDREWEQDEKKKNMRYTYESNVNDEAEERKNGGRAKKHIGKMHGGAANHNAGRKARKSGGRAGSNMNPLSSAHAGTAPKGRKIEMND
jgi:hypothetical protein